MKAVVTQQDVFSIHDVTEKELRGICRRILDKKAMGSDLILIKTEYPASNVSQTHLKRAFFTQWNRLPATEPRKPHF